MRNPMSAVAGVVFLGLVLVYPSMARADALIDRWRAIVADYPIPAPPTGGVIEILPTETPAQIQTKITGAATGAVFLIIASGPNTPTDYRRWKVTPKANQKFYGQLGTDNKTRLITLKGSKDKSPGVPGITWTLDDASGLWWCSEDAPLGSYYQSPEPRYPEGYRRNAYGRTVMIDGTNALNIL